MSKAIEKFLKRQAKAKEFQDQKTASKHAVDVMAEVNEDILSVAKDSSIAMPLADNKVISLPAESVATKIFIEQESIKEAFEKWLIENGHAKKHVPAIAIASIDKASVYAISRKLTKVSLFEIIDVKKFNVLRAKIQQDKIYKMSERGNAKTFESSGIIYSKFLKEFDFSKYTSEPTVKQQAGYVVGKGKEEDIVEVAPPKDVSNVIEENRTNVDENAYLKGLAVSLQIALKDISGKQFILEATPLKNEGFIFDIISNGVSFGKDNILCPEFISSEGSLYEIHSHSIVDFKLNETTNVRRSYLTNDFSLLKKTVEETLNCVEQIKDKFYYLPDNTDLFSNNIKSGFSGYTFVWRSVAAAYRNYKISKSSDIKVIDLFEREPVKIFIKAKKSKKHGNAIMFTRYRKEKLEKVKPLSYPVVAKAFWKDFAKKNSLSNLNINALRYSNLTYNLLCRGEAFNLIFNDKRFAINATLVKVFLKAYFQKHNDAFEELTGCVIYGDFLTFTDIAYNFTVLKDNEIGEPLEEFKSRLKSNIPLWVETLPKLALGRIANKGRLGEYVLVDEGKEVENLFAKIRIPCKELLTLPAGKKEIRFPLAIGGSISDKSFIAKVELEEALPCRTNFNVELQYDFNNEKSYEFILSNDQIKFLQLTIEEGIPEKSYLKFVMQIDENNEIVREIYENLIVVESWLRRRLFERNGSFFRPEKNGFLIEKRWEFGVRVACNKIFSLWLGLPYSVKARKVYDNQLTNKVREIAKLVEYSQDTDNIDRCYNGLVHITIALLSKEIEYKADHYSFFLENRKGHQMLEHAVESKVLCNPDIVVNSIETILRSCKGINLIRTFSLPFLANEELVDYFCQNRLEMLQKATKLLVSCFEKLREDIEKDNQIRFQMRVIRDAYEFTLGLLKLRESECWSAVKGIENALPYCVELESKLFSRLLGELKKYDIRNKNYNDLIMAQNWIDKRGNAIDVDLLISRVAFKGDDNYQELRMMHPLALTAITYLEGNPDIHIIGCGLKDEAD